MLLIHYPSMPRFRTHGSLGVHRGGINGDGGQGKERGQRRHGQGQIHGRGQNRGHGQSRGCGQDRGCGQGHGGQVGAAEQGQRGIARRVGRPRLAWGAPEERILNP